MSSRTSLAGDGEAAARLAVGLCADCANARRVTSTRGSTFWRCALADRDPRYAKYPRLPVLRCPGHVARGNEA
jgi:hypothetical protein